MMLCDTDWMIDFLNGKDSAIHLLAPLIGQELSLSIISAGEIYEGIVGSSERQRAEAGFAKVLGLIRVLSLDLLTMRIYGELRAHLRSQGRLIGDNDLLIAATALRYDLTLVTRNRRHFDRIPGLRLHDPATP